MDRLIAPGREISRERAALHVSRHHHLSAYAAVVLRGCYVEAGDRGRFRAEPGDVLFHDRFEAHQDQFGPAGADILNLALEAAPDFACGRVDDPDALARIARRDARAAAAMLAACVRPAEAALADWPDLLAADLVRDRVASLALWADNHRLLPSSLSRGFRSCYGVSPQRFRLEQRARRAARAVALGGIKLAALAAREGFADQAHMSRTMRSLYGRSPLALARDNCVQDQGVGAA